MNLLKPIGWYMGNIWDFSLQMLPCMCIGLAVFCILRPVRMKRLERLGLSSGPGREGALLLFVMFCAGLAALTLFPANFWRMERWYWVLQGTEPLFRPIDWQIRISDIQLNPFQEILRAFRGPWVMFMMVANIGIFSPVGFFPALLWHKPHWWKSLLIGFAASFTIEFVQLFVGRSSDIDDLILNTTGALAGYWLFLLLRALFPKFTAKFQCERKGIPNG